MASRSGSAAALASAGVPVWIDSPSGIAHNKFMIVDDDLVIGGSFNYTAAARARNAENVT
jgi:phospholipase D